MINRSPLNAKLCFTVLTVLAGLYFSFGFGRQPVLKPSKTNHQPTVPKRGFTKKASFKSTLPSFCSAVLSGNTCVGSTLTLNSSDPVASISWLLDGVSVLDQTINKQNNGQVVAGGNGTGNAANQLYNPNRLFVDQEGNMYIPDMANNRIQKWTSGATSGTTIAGGNGTGNAPNQFNRPTAVTADALGNIYVADQNNSRIQKWSVGATSGVTVATSLNTPTGICLDAAGNLYVSEQNGQCVRKYTNATGTGVIVAGGNGYGSSSNQLASPTGIFVDNKNNLYICDTDNSRIQKWVIGASSGTTVARISGNPLGVYVDGTDNIYITDYTGFSVQKWPSGASNGTIIAGGNGQGSNPNQITPAGVWMDKYNNLYVSDFLNGRIIKFSNIYTGTYTALKAGTYTAKITTTSGCIAISNAIVIQNNATPKITISSNTTVACSQFGPTFTASIADGGANPTIQWKVNSVAVPNANATSFAASGLKAGDLVSCEVINNDICVINALALSNTIALITPIESPTVSIDLDRNNVCQGAKLTFTATATNAGTSPSYHWKINNVALPSATGNVFESTDLNDNDEVSCEINSDAQYCQATAIASSNIVKVKVNPILTPSIAIVADQTKIYENTNVTFRANTTNEGTSPTYQWFVNGYPTGSDNSTFTTNSLKDGDEINCLLNVSTLCTSSNTVVSNTLIITVIKVIKVVPSNTFTPNGDGVNDLWTIEELKSFPKCKVQVFNRNGTEIYNSIGYAKPWDGTYKNKICNPGVYYYVINLDGDKIISGSLTLLK